MNAAVAPGDKDQGSAEITAEQVRLDEALTQAEANLLDACERSISRGLNTFLEVGNALTTIQQDRLYRTAYGTFEAYCDQKWGMSRKHAYGLIAASDVVQQLSPKGDTVPPPASERVARELAVLRTDPETLQGVWQEATRGGVTPTAAAVHAVVAKRRPALSRLPLPDQLTSAAGEMSRNVKRLNRLMDDDRFPKHATAFVQRNRLDVNSMIELGRRLTAICDQAQVADGGAP